MAVKVMFTTLLVLGTSMLVFADKKCFAPVVCNQEDGGSNEWLQVFPHPTCHWNEKANSSGRVLLRGDKGDMGPRGKQGERGIQGMQGIANTSITDALRKEITSLRAREADLNATTQKQQGEILQLQTKDREFIQRIDNLLAKITNLETSQNAQINQISSLQSQVGSIETGQASLLKAAVDQNTLCYMGMKSGAIPDTAISAISSSSPARRGRLDYAGSWMPSLSISGRWIQVDLGEPKLVAGIVSQGRGDSSDGGHDWVSSYMVSCGSTVETLATITENGISRIFTGNNDFGTKVVNMFPKLMTCRYIRISPHTWPRWIAMRIEFIHGFCRALY